MTNASGSATGSGAVTLNGGTLASGVFGTISGNVIAGTAAHTIAPGGVGSIGTITLGGLTTNSNTTLNFDLGGAVAGGVYTGDLITIGSGGFTAGNGTVITFGTNPSTPGDYRLFGGNFGSPTFSNFTLPTAPSNTTYSLTTEDTGYLDLKVAVSSISGQWNVNNPTATAIFSYNTGSNWDTHVVPNHAGHTATFATGNPAGTVNSATVTVNVDVAATLGSIVFNAASTAYTLGDGGGSISLDNSPTGGSLLDVQAGSHTIMPACSLPIRQVTRSTSQPAAR